MSVQQADQPAGMVGPNGNLLDDPDAAAPTHRCGDQVLEVYRGEVSGIEVIELDRLAPCLERAVDGSVTPMRVPITDSAHAEGELLLDLDEDFAFVWVIEPQSRAFDFSAPGLPVEFVADVMAFADAGRAPWGRTVGNGIDDQRGLEPPPAVFVLVHGDM